MGRWARSRSARITARVDFTWSRRRRSTVIRSRASRRSVSIWDSPGPRVPMPPTPRPAPRRSRCVHRPRMRAMLYSSWASSTCILPSAVCAWPAKMSRITAVRSSTGTSSCGLEVALLARRELVVGDDDVRVRLLEQRLELVDLAGAEIEVRVRLVALLRQLAHGRDAGGAQQLLELGEVLVVRATRRWRRRAASPGRRPAAGRSGTGLCGRCESVPRPSILEGRAPRPLMPAAVAPAPSETELAERLAARTLELIDIPSESRSEAALAAYVASELRGAAPGRGPRRLVRAGLPARDAAASAARRAPGHGAGAGQHPGPGRGRARGTGSAPRT